METYSDEIEITGSLAPFQDEGYSCKMISSYTGAVPTIAQGGGAGTGVLYDATTSSTFPWTSTIGGQTASVRGFTIDYVRTCRVQCDSALELGRDGLPGPLGFWTINTCILPLSHSLWQDQAIFPTHAVCLDSVTSGDAFWASCKYVCPNPNPVCSESIVCGTGIDWATSSAGDVFNGVKITIVPVFQDHPSNLPIENFFGAAGTFTDAHVAPLAAAVRADTVIANMLPTKACSPFPFPPFACVKRTTEKTFTWLGVLSLSIANTELV